MKYVSLFPILAAGFVSACGGGDSSEFSEASVMRVFEDGSGIAKLTASDGGEALLMASDIAAGVQSINEDSEDANDVSSSYSDLDITSQYAGYNIREGAIQIEGLGGNVIAAEKDGETRIAVIEFPDLGETMLTTYSPSYDAPSTGSYEYTGIYVVGERYGDSSELGTVVLTGNFTTDRVSIDAVSTSTRLSGSGFIDGNSGRISGNGFTFTSPSNSTYNATVLGKFGGTNAAEASGMFYTNDAYPDYAGAFAATRQWLLP